MFQPKYTITHSIVNNLITIAEVRSLVTHTSILPKQEARLRHKALVRMIHSSTSIEGNQLNPYEVERVLAGESIQASERDIIEVKNYQLAMQYVSNHVAQHQAITQQTILEIHRLVTQGVLPEEKSGHFRKQPVYVVSRQGSRIIEVRYTGPEAKQVLRLVQQLLHWITQANQTNICPVIIAGLVHAEIAAIHPFADGNGRTARILATLILYEKGYDFRKLFALEDYYNANRPAYYQAIHLGKTYAKRSAADMTNWLEYFIAGFSSEMEAVRELLIPLSLDAKMRNKLGGQVQLDPKQLKLIDFIMTMERITSKDVQDIITVKERRAQNYLKTLEEMQLLRRVGQGPATYYVLNI